MDKILLSVGWVFLSLSLHWAVSGGSAEAFERIEVRVDQSDETFQASMSEAIEKLRREGNGQIELTNPEVFFLPGFGPGAGMLDLLPSGQANYLSAHDAIYRSAYRNGDMYFLVGDLTAQGQSKDTWPEEEWREYYDIARWLVKKRFKAILNPAAQQVDVREAVTNPRTAGIIWSGHGSLDGLLTDYIGHVLDGDTFSKDASPSFRHLVWSSCNGEKVVQTYKLQAQTTAHHWFGSTYTSELFKYLRSSRWDQDLLKDLKLREF